MKNQRKISVKSTSKVKNRMNIKECAKVTGKSYPAVRRLCLKHCPGQFLVQGIGHFKVTDSRASGKGKAIYDIERVYSKEVGMKENNDGKSATILKEQHLQIKIKKEEQLLYENKLLLAEKIADAFINLYHLPRVLKLTEIVRKHGTRELITAWNKQVEIGATENLKELQDELQNLTLS